MLIKIDLPFVLLISVPTDAKKPWAGLSCILNTSYPIPIILTASLKVFPLQWNFSFGTSLFERHLHSEDTKFGPGKMFT